MRHGTRQLSGKRARHGAGHRRVAGFYSAAWPDIAPPLTPMLEGTDERIRAEAGEDARGVFSVSQLEDVVVCRYLGASMTQAKTLFGRAWQVLRAGPMGKRAVAPRIWAT